MELKWSSDFPDNGARSSPFAHNHDIPTVFALNHHQGFFFVVPYPQQHCTTTSATTNTTMSSTNTCNAEDDLIDDALLATVFIILQELQDKSKPRQSRGHSSGEGQHRVHSLLNSDSNDRIKAALRMSKDTFFSLRDWLINNTKLKASKHVSVEMKLAIFLYITTRPASQRDTIEHYSIGPRVISE